jgi:O-antigen ligase
VSDLDRVVDQRFAPVTRILEAGLFFLIISLLFARGTFHEALDILLVGLGLKLFWPEAGWKIPETLRFSLSLLTLLWAWGVCPHFATPEVYGSPLLMTGVILLALFQVSERLFERLSWRDLEAPFLALFVLLNGVADGLYQGPENSSQAYAGLFSNIHYMAEYALIVAPLLVLEIQRYRGWKKGILILALVGDFLLLLATKSRPGYFAAMASVLVLLPWVAPAIRYRLIVGLILIIGMLYAGNLGHFADRLNDLAQNLAHEERMTIWGEFFEMLTLNTPLQWLFGHGLGQFALDFAERAEHHAMPPFLSPHNFLFEILYSHGVLGVMTTLIILVLPYWFLLQKKIENHELERLALTASLTALWVHAFFTIPFFSRDFLLPLGLLWGLVLILAERPLQCSSSSR